MTDLRDKLRAKGWSNEEIEKTVSIVGEAKKKKTGLVKVSESIVYWVALFLLIVGNFFMSVLLIPFQLVFNEGFIYVAVVLLAFTFGIIFTVVLWEIESLETKQHIIAWIFIPAISLINVYIMVTLSNFIATLIRLKSAIHDAPLISVAYVVAFMIPYISMRTYKHFKK